MSMNAPIPALPGVAPVPTLDHERLEVYQRAWLLEPGSHRKARDLAVRLVQMLSCLCAPPR